MLSLKADYNAEKSKATSAEAEAELNIKNLKTDVQTLTNSLSAPQSQVELLTPLVQSAKADADAANAIVSSIASRIAANNDRIKILMA